MSKVAIRPSVAEFLEKYPTVDGYTLLCVCEEINRRTGAGIGAYGILTQALLLDNAGKYLVSVCESFQNQSSN
jgi:hypothetical protein